jgi:hypothetical protein
MRIKNLFIFLWCINGYGQILNIDREIGVDSLPRSIIGVIDLSFSVDKQRRDIIELTQQTEIDFLNKENTNILIVLAHTDLVFNGVNVLENNGYFQLRFRDNDIKKIAADYYAQYQWNGILGLQNRAVAGCNARFKFWDDRTDDLYAGLGVFYEFERWNPFLENYAFGGTDLQEVNRSLIRLNMTLKTAINLNNGLDFSAITYIQAPLNAGVENILNPRWFLDAQLNFHLNRHLDFQIKYNQNLDFLRPLPIDSFFYSSTLGCRVKF